MIRASVPIKRLRRKTMAALKKQIITAITLIMLAPHAWAETPSQILTGLIGRAAQSASGLDTDRLTVLLKQGKNAQTNRSFAVYLGRRIAGIISMEKNASAPISVSVAEIPAAEFSALSSKHLGDGPGQGLMKKMPGPACALISCSKSRKNIGLRIRIIDVSGESIIFDDRADFRLKPRLEPLFDPGLAAAEIEEIIADDLCADMKSGISRALRSGGEDISSALALARSVDPFARCGSIHSLVIDCLLRMKITDEEYRRFIIRSLGESRTARPDEIKGLMVMDMVRFLSSDGAVDDEELEAGLTALAGLEPGEFPQACIQELIFTGEGEPSDSRIIERIDRYFSATSAACAPGAAPGQRFNDMVQAISSTPPCRAGTTGLLRCFEAYGGPDDTKYARTHYQTLRRACLAEEDPVRMVSLLKIVYRQFLPGKEINTGNLPDFISLLDECAAALQQHGLAAVIGELGIGLSESFPALADKNERKIAALFCMRHGIPCPGIVPPEQDIVSLLSSTDEDDASDGIDYALALPANTAEVESAIALLMKNSETKAAHGSTALLEKAMTFCTVRRCAGPETVPVMISLLDSPLPGICHRAAEALEAAGGNAVPMLVSNAMRKDDFSALLSIIVLKRIEPSSEKISSMLQSKAASTRNRWIAAEARDMPEKNR